MNPRERKLAIAVLSLAVLAGGAYLFYTLFLIPLGDMDEQLIKLKDEVQQKEARVHQIEAAKVRLTRYKQLSLPQPVDYSRREYENFLSDLLQESGFPSTKTITPRNPEKSSVVGPDKKPVYTRLPYTIVAKANLGNLVDLLERFYRTPFLHQIKKITVQRASTIGAQVQQGQQAPQFELDINLTVEALVVNGATERLPLPEGGLLPSVDRRLFMIDVAAALRHAPGLGLVLWAAGPTGPAGPGVLAKPSRHYAAIAKKNIFFGSSALDRPEVVQVARYVHLTDITCNTGRTPPRCEAFFYDRYNGRMTRLRAEPGFDTFQILDSDNEPIVRGRVIRLDDRELIFRANDNYYSIHVGQNLDEALKRRLTSSQLRDLGLTTVAEEVSTENGKLHSRN
jgi:hypothetical protein